MARPSAPLLYFMLTKLIFGRLGIKKRSAGNATTILVVAPLLLGDLMMLAPFINGLRQKYPQAPLVLVCRCGLGAFAKKMFSVTSIESDKPTNVDVKKIIQSSPDGFKACYVLFAGNWLPYLTRVPMQKLISFADPKGRWTHLIDVVIAFPTSSVELISMPFFLLEDQVVKNHIPNDRWRPQQNLAVLHVGARNLARRMHDNQIIQLISFLTEARLQTIAITGLPGEGPPLQELKKAVGDKAVIRDLRGEMALDDLPEVFITARIMIGVDTGATHLAKALGVPTLVLMGQSQLGVFGNDNMFSRSRHFFVGDLACRDKHTIHGFAAKQVATCNRRECPVAGRPCLADPLPQTIKQLLTSLLEETQKEALLRQH